jgi:SPP1 gp7 family putative phage head morphogenesis protein
MTTPSIIQTAAEETVEDIRAWADAIWEGREPDVAGLQRRLVMLLTVAAMGGVSTAEMDEMVGEPGEPDRHYGTEEVFRGMVEAIVKKRPTLAVLSPRQLSDNLKQSAWYVSGVLKERVLERIRTRLIEARVKGHGLGWFQAQVSQEADLTLPHIQTVFRTNVESAAGAARWRQLHDPDTEDMWWGYRYWNPRDERSRPLHAAMHGFVAAKEDPIWRTIWTPNGYQCRCKVRPLERHEAVGKLIDEKGRRIADRWFATPLQRQVVQSIDDRTDIIVGRKTLRFPDEGFRGNAMLNLV